jgi:hypothetical protein
VSESRIHPREPFGVLSRPFQGLVVMILFAMHIFVLCWRLCVISNRSKLREQIQVLSLYVFCMKTCAIFENCSASLGDLLSHTFFVSFCIVTSFWQLLICGVLLVHATIFGVLLQEKENY